MQTLFSTPNISACISELTGIVGAGRIISEEAELLVYESDGYLVERQLPEVVVFPLTTEEVARVIKCCGRYDVPCLPRGAGTSLAGGCLPVNRGVIISLAKMIRVLEIDVLNKTAYVEAGLLNGELNRALSGTGLHFAPDPSSAHASTLGGNVATNAGGPHTLKYGVTSNHVLGLTVVLPDGEIIKTGGTHAPITGMDLTGLFVGSEGTLGICTEIMLKLTCNPQSYRTQLAVFESVAQACEVVSKIIGNGLLPAALELMDQAMLRAMEENFHFGLPVDAGAILIIEVDGCEVSIEEQAEEVVALCRQGGAREIRVANTAIERAELWKCRKQAFGAIGRLSSGFCTQDGVVPRSKLPEILAYVEAVAQKYQVRIFNVFHAGDGNIHPILLFDERDADLMQRMKQASHDILVRCIEMGGTVTGEHGIGVEKREFMPLMFSAATLELFHELRVAFTKNVKLSPGKML